MLRKFLVTVDCPDDIAIGYAEQAILIEQLLNRYIGKIKVKRQPLRKYEKKKPRSNVG